MPKETELSKITNLPFVDEERKLRKLNKIHKFKFVLLDKQGIFFNLSLKATNDNWLSNNKPLSCQYIRTSHFIWIDSLMKAFHVFSQNCATKE